MKYLLDTCVLSDLVARQPTADVAAWVDSVEETRLHLSAITIGEIRKGIDRLPVSLRRTELETWLSNDLLARFEGRVLSLDAALLLTWGRLTAEWEAAGRVLPAIDSLIAATAVHHGLILVTRNVRDFDGTGLTIHNPWPAT